MILLTPTAPIAFPVTCFANTGLLRPGTSRPVCTEKSRGAITNFWIFQLLFWQTFLSVSLLWMVRVPREPSSDKDYERGHCPCKLQYPHIRTCRLKPVRVLPTQAMATASAAAERRVRVGFLDGFLDVASATQDPPDKERFTLRILSGSSLEQGEDPSFTAPCCNTEQNARAAQIFYSSQDRTWLLRWQSSNQRRLKAILHGS